MNSEDLKKLAQHLYNPIGEDGIKVAENMNISNAQIISNSIHYLDIKPNQNILEIGHGNGKHIPQYFDKASNIHFYGLETSDAMSKIAKKYNKKYKANFGVYNGVNIPFDENYFDKIISVNTIYFWSDPVKLLNEIEQTLKPEGIVVISFVDKTVMQNLNFVNELFTLYNIEDFTNLVDNCNLQIATMEEKIEKVKSKSGEWVNKKYYMFKLTHI